MLKLLPLLVLFSCAREPAELAPPTRIGEQLLESTRHERARILGPQQVRSLGSEVAQAHALGYQQAKVEEELKVARAQLTELHQIVVFSDCIERKSGMPAKVALEYGMSLESCRLETLEMTVEELDLAATTLVSAPPTPTPAPSSPLKKRR